MDKVLPVEEVEVLPIITQLFRVVPPEVAVVVELLSCVLGAHRVLLLWYWPLEVAAEEDSGTATLDRSHQVQEAQAKVAALVPVLVVDPVEVTVMQLVAAEALREVQALEGLATRVLEVMEQAHLGRHQEVQVAMGMVATPPVLVAAAVVVATTVEAVVVVITATAVATPVPVEAAGHLP